jgi:hypothetical protein
VRRHGDRAGAVLLDAYRRLVRDVVQRFGGAEIKTEGDSFYVVFSSASDAVRCGLAISAAAASASLEQPGRPIAVGVGIHAGESTETAEGYVGSAVNIAARVCAAAAAGEVLVTDTVRGLTRTSGDIGFSARGRRHLKGITEPVAVYAASAGRARPAPGGNARPLARSQQTILTAAGAMVLVASLALGGVLVLSRSPGPAGTPAPSVLAALSSSSRAPSLAPPSLSTAFPTAAEVTLLQTLPAGIGATCVRGRDQVDLEAAGFTGTVGSDRSGKSSPFTIGEEPVMPPPSKASLACRPTAGASGAWFLWYDLTGAPDPISPAQVAVADIGARFRVSDGDCAEPPARGSWRSSLGASGFVICLKDTGPGGQPWIYWGFGSAHVLGAATAPIGQYQVLYDWWQALTPFLN